MKGDQLASGGRSATFAATDKPKNISTTAYDLQTMGVDAFQEKYGVNPERYAELVYGLSKGAPTPDLSPLPSANDLDRVAEEETIVSRVDNSALFKKKPVTFYRGRPLGDMILVRRVERESNSSLVLPDMARGKSDMGKVIGVGSGLQDAISGQRTPPDVREGDLILFDKFASVGMEVQLLDENGDEKEHLILREHDVLLVLEKVTPEFPTPLGVVQ